MALQPLTPLGQSAARRVSTGGLSAYGSTPEEAERNLLEKIGMGALSTLGMAGNLLDLPGSMVRDVLVGENPFDQWASPLQAENRATGSDVLTKLFGMRKNKETGFVPLEDPGEFGRDVARLGAEIVLDPLSYLTFGGAALTKSGKAAQKAGLLEYLPRLAKNNKMGMRQARTTMTADDLLKVAPEEAAFKYAEKANPGGITDEILQSGERLGHTVGFGLPFGQNIGGVNLGPIGSTYNKAADALTGYLGQLKPVRHTRKLFDNRVLNQHDPILQEIAEERTLGQKFSDSKAVKKWLEKQDDSNPIFEKFAEQYGDKVTPDYDWRVDPREIGRWKKDEGVLAEFEAEQARAIADRAEREMDIMAPIVKQFKKDFPDFMDRLRKQGDHEIESLIDHDLMLDEFNRRVMGNDRWYNEGNIYGTGELSDFLQAPKRKAYKPRTLTEIAEEARREAIAAGRDVQNPDLFVPGDIVEALDKGNFGRVHEITSENKTTVYFRNPETGAEAFVPLNNKQLKRRWTGQSKEAEVYAQEVRRKVFDKVVKLTGETNDVNLAFRKILGTTDDISPELGAEILQHAGEMRDANAAVLSALEEKGIMVSWLKDADADYGIEHFPRFVNPKVAEQRGLQNAPRLLPTEAGFMQARQIETRDLPEFVANQLHLGQKYRTDNGAKNIQRDFDEWLNPGYRDYKGEVIGKEGHAQALAKFLKGTKAGELYTQDYLKNFLQYQQQAELLNTTADAIHDVLQRHGTDAAGPGMVSIDQALEVAGLDPINSKTYFRQRHGVDASSRYVPEDLIPQLKGVMDIGKSPEWATGIGKTIDKFNKMFKSWVTLPFPGFAFRNHTSGQHMNLASGFVNGFGDLAAYTSAYGRMFKLQKMARENPAALKDADRKLLQNMLAYRVISPHGFEDIDLSSVAIQSRPTNPIADIIPPGVSVPGVGDSGRTLWRKAKGRVAENSDTGLSSMEGKLGSAARTARTAVTTVTDAGATLNSLVEWQNRGAMFSYLVEKKGWSPQAAAQKVSDLQLDYSAMSDFEKSTMRRAVPFYAFTRKIVPQLIETIRTQPGGALAQTIRTTNQGGEDPNRPLPDYVAQTSAIPLGEREDGSQSFLTGFGFAHEVPLQYLGGGLRGAGVEALSQLNPLIKGPLEYFTGESFFQRGPLGGRDIDDLDPTVGRILTQAGLQDEKPSGQAKPVFGSQLAENVIANSPASRTLTTLRMLLDPRKREETAAFPGDALAMNLLTGARVSDVTPVSQDALVRDTIQAMVKQEGGKSFETARFSNKIIERAEQQDPEQADRMRAFNAYLNLLAKRARERAKERAAKG